MRDQGNLGSDDLIAIRQMRIVVCDDTDRSRVGEVLNSDGFQAIMFVASADLLGSLAGMQIVGGVLLQIDPSIPDSMTLLMQLRTQQPLIPVITMGDITQLRVLRKSVDLGATNYVVMPVDRELLRRKCLHAFYRPSSSLLATHEHTTI